MKRGDRRPGASFTWYPRASSTSYAIRLNRIPEAVRPPSHDSLGHLVCIRSGQYFQIIRFYRPCNSCDNDNRRRGITIEISSSSILDCGHTTPIPPPISHLGGPASRLRGTRRGAQSPLTLNSASPFIKHHNWAHTRPSLPQIFSWHCLRTICRPSSSLKGTTET